jgi:hypothetical protein
MVSGVSSSFWKPASPPKGPERASYFVSLSHCPVNSHRRSYRPTMDTFTELRQLADDLTELGDIATAALVRQTIDKTD